MNAPRFSFRYFLNPTGNDQNEDPGNIPEMIKLKKGHSLLRISSVAGSTATDSTRKSFSEILSI